MMNDIDAEFEELLKVLKYPINCLIDDDRNTRKNGLSTISKHVNTASVPHLMRLMNASSPMHRNLIRVLGDKVENNREVALAIFEKAYSRLNPDQIRKDDVEPVLVALITRIGATPFPETGEELRLKIVNLLIKITAFRDTLLANLPELANALSKCLLDPYAEIKKSSCALVDALCDKVRNRIGFQSTSIVKSLTINMAHQHSKVRKSSLITLGHILATEGAGANFQICQLGLKNALSDKIPQVRKAALDCTAALLRYFGPKYLQLHEPTLVSLLLMGLHDESPENSAHALVLMEQCGTNLYELYQSTNPTAMITESP